jgi:hypothetical protein
MKLNFGNWRQIPFQILSMIHEDAIKKENHIYHLSQNIISRSYTLLGFLVPAISIFFSPFYSATNLGDPAWTILLQALAIAFLLYAFFLLVINIRVTYLKYPGGNEPQEICQPEYLEPKYLKTEQERQSAWMLMRIETAQEHISSNKVKNSAGFRRLNQSIIATSAGLLLGLGYFILNLLL